MAILPVRLCVPFAALLVRAPTATLLRRRSTTCIRSLSSSSTKMMASSASNEQQQQQQAVPTNKKQNQPIVQYIFLRRDLDWPAGAMAAQAAHVSVAAITQAVASQDEAALAYVAPANLPHMTKYVYGVDDLAALEQVRAVWNELIQSTVEQEHPVDATEQDKATALHSYWWMEQPENTPTAFGTWPVMRTNKVSKVIKKLNVSFF
jgi:peptidyl-tRNA hydrolase